VQKLLGPNRISRSGDGIEAADLDLLLELREELLVVLQGGERSDYIIFKLLLTQASRQRRGECGTANLAAVGLRDAEHGLAGLVHRVAKAVTSKLPRLVADELVDVLERGHGRLKDALEDTLLGRVQLLPNARAGGSVRVTKRRRNRGGTKVSLHDDEVW